MISRTCKTKNSINPLINIKIRKHFLLKMGKKIVEILIEICLQTRQPQRIAPTLKKPS